MRRLIMLSFPDFEKKRIVVVFATEGQKFAIKNDNLVVKNSDDKIILQDTCYRVLSLWIIGNCSVTSVLLKKSKKHGFPIFHLGGNFRLIGVWNSATEGNFLLRYKQYQYSNKEIAKRLVLNKITNQMELLKALRQKDEMTKLAIEQLSSYLVKIPTSTDWKEILGVEGIASKVFFSAYFSQTNWKGRQPRAKMNSMNVLMDIGYTFLFYWIENMLSLYGFDLYKGVYHQNFYQRKSLVCDIIEPFRCIIDNQLRKAYNLGQIKEDDFIVYRNQYQLKPEKSKEYTRWLLLAILDYKEPIYYYCRDYYRAFITEKPVENYPFFNYNSPKKI
jgi:CRISPR-associated protein Cas1